MSQQIQMKLNTDSVKSIPFQTYENNFIFIVNNKEYRTSNVVASLISPKICKMFKIDPTISEFTIKTRYQGNFQHILNLVNFQANAIPESDILFIKEISEILENESLEIINENDIGQIQIDNVFNRIIYHEKFPLFYSHQIEEEIDFISSHFYEIEASQEEEISKLTIESIERILSNKKLQLKSEDQLISIINKLCSNDSKYSNLYSFIEFSNVSENKMTSFLSIFDYNLINAEIWRKLTERLENPIFIEKSDKKEDQKFKRYQNLDEITMYNRSFISIPCRMKNELNGIITYLRKNSYNKITDEIEVTSSSVNENNLPQNAILYNDRVKGFETKNEENPWICIDFKKHRVIPKFYTIRSWNWSSFGSHPKNWVIEGSNDNNKYEILDEQKNCSLLKGSSISHTFSIEKNENKKYRFLRMRSTGEDWMNTNYLSINSIEFNGLLIL